MHKINKEKRWSKNSDNPRYKKNVIMLVLYQVCPRFTVQPQKSSLWSKKFQSFKLDFQKSTALSIRLRLGNPKWIKF